MEQIAIDMENLKLIELLEKSLTNDEVVSYPYGVFYGNVGNADWPIYLYEAEEALVMDEDFDIHDTVSFLKESKDNFVFAVFSTTNVGEPIVCVDGNYYGYAVAEDDEEYEEEIFIDEGDYYGYFIQLNENKYVIDTAIHSLVGLLCSGEIVEDSIRIEEYCGLFEKPMKSYIKRFII
ncbi:UNVERIFIED_CONTAM: hypothetical protein Cloal_1330 [Acetivibrio alkalicellulosi]